MSNHQNSSGFCGTLSSPSLFYLVTFPLKSQSNKEAKRSLSHMSPGDWFHIDWRLQSVELLLQGTNNITALGWFNECLLGQNGNKNWLRKSLSSIHSQTIFSIKAWLNFKKTQKNPLSAPSSMNHFLSRDWWTGGIKIRCILYAYILLLLNHAYLFPMWKTWV